MKTALCKLLYACSLLAATITNGHAQTCNFTDLRLNSQAAVNNFNSTCKNVKGNILISGADITDLGPLSSIETIDGGLTIQNNSNLTSLSGLENLTSTKHLLIYTNDLLTNLSGLEGLKSVSNTTHIRFNKNLLSLNGLNNLTSASIFYITNNDLLTDLSGLGSLETVSDVLSVGVNKSLVSLNGLTNLTSVSRILIGENDLLPSLSGLESLTSVSYQMNINSNKSLTSLNGLDNLTFLSELYISNNNLLADMSGLENINSVYWLVIGESKGLTSLAGLNNLTSATNFIIRANPLLTDLSGLEKLTNIGWISVTDNAELTTLSGLGAGSHSPEEQGGSNGRVSAALAIGGLSITNNPKLTTCAVSSVCDFVRTNTANISGNAAGCENEAAVELACSSLPVTLVHFVASAEGQNAVLQWSTAEESNSSVFQIEYSLDAKNWNKVGEHAARGKSQQLTSYRWVHREPGNTQNYYRLKMVDLDGSYAHSQVVNVKFSEPAQTPVLIYPNPVADILFIENETSVVDLRIVNLQGKTIFETNKVDATGISVKNLIRGLYEVKIIRLGGKVQAERIAIL